MSKPRGPYRTSALPTGIVGGHEVVIYFVIDDRQRYVCQCRELSVAKRIARALNMLEEQERKTKLATDMATAPIPKPAPLIRSVKMERLTSPCGLQMDICVATDHWISLYFRPVEEKIAKVIEKSLREVSEEGQR